MGVLILLKTKCDHLHHVCTDGFAPWWWKWSRRGFSLFTAYQILSAEFIENSTWQSCDSKLQYNTCGGRNGVLFAALDHIVWPCESSDTNHIVSDVFCRADHMRQLVCFLAAFCVVLLCRISDFEIYFSPKNDDHISIIRYLDLTTSLTINRSGVHGDKMSGEYEKAVFA